MIIDMFVSVQIDGDSLPNLCDPSDHLQFSRVIAARSSGDPFPILMSGAGISP